MDTGNGKYRLKNELLNGVALPRAVTGQSIAHSGLSLVQRAYEAADMYNGLSRLVRPTQLQVAALWKVNPTYVHWARMRPNDRALVESNAVPLVPPATVKALPAPVSPVERLADIVSEVGFTGTLDMLTTLEGTALAAE